MSTRRLTLVAAASTIALAGAAGLAAPAIAATDSTDTTITDVEQAVGMPATGTCDAVDDAALDWSGVASGGWQAGWGQWLNDGAGGVACVRTLTYSPSSGTWSVVVA
jgi:hypothetical protein